MSRLRTTVIYMTLAPASLAASVFASWLVFDLATYHGEQSVNRNRFVPDVVSGSKLPARIMPDASTPACVTDDSVGPGATAPGSSSTSSSDPGPTESIPATDTHYDFSTCAANEIVDDPDPVFIDPNQVS